MEAPVTTTPKTDSPTSPAAETQEAGADEELKFSIPGDRRIAAANAITSRAMARRLPQLIRRALSLLAGRSTAPR